MIPKGLRSEIEQSLAAFDASIFVTWLDKPDKSSHADCIMCCKGHYIELIFAPYSENISGDAMAWSEYKVNAGAKIFIINWYKATRPAVFIYFGLTDALKYIAQIERVPFGFCKFK